MACNHLFRALPVMSFAVFGAAQAIGQSANNDAVTTAEDAFGFSLGSEASGLYSTTSVRGFNPTSAGNVRIEGLYFDQQAAPSYRAVSSSAVRIGLNSRGYTLPSPSGVVDYSLRQTSDQASASATVGIEPLIAPVLELSATTGKQGNWSVTGSLALYPRNVDFRGGRGSQESFGVVPRWSPTDNLQITGFYELDKYRSESSPTYYTAGDFLPPRIERGNRHSQPWAIYSYIGQNAGGIVDFKLGASTKIRGGLFRSIYKLKSGDYDLITGIDRDGFGQRTVYAYPKEFYGSTSGELQAEHVFVAGSTRNTARLIVRGRKSDKLYGGAPTFDLGLASIYDPPQVSEPIGFAGPQTEDDVRQFTVGANYRLEWAGKVDLSLGLQKTWYRKEITVPGRETVSGESSPFLYNFLAAWMVKPRLVIYAGLSKGLEESGIAPAATLNRGEVLPAIITSQRELGIRTTLQKLTFTASLFDIRRPYAGRNEANIFTLVGNVRHRGVEISVAGELIKGLSLLAGGVFLDAKVDREAETGLPNFRPLARPQYRVQASFNYEIPSIPRFSVDGSVNFLGKQEARISNRLNIPAYQLVNFGMRYRFMDKKTTVRVQVLNLLNKYGYSVDSSEGFIYLPQRRLRFLLTKEF